MSVTYVEMVGIIQFIGWIFSNIFDMMRSVTLVTEPTITLLDLFCAFWFFDATWDFINSLR